MADMILVVGATGMQGGGVARQLLKSGTFKVRCMTRRPESEPARLLQQQGAEVVQADLDDPASLKRAVHNCTAVFGVTNFWEAYFREYDQGVNLIDAAAAEAGVGHLVLSTLPSSRKISRDVIDLPHFETKARMEEYARFQHLPFTFVHVAFYYENFLNYFPPLRQPDGSYSFVPAWGCAVGRRSRGGHRRRGSGDPSRPDGVRRQNPRDHRGRDAGSTIRRNDVKCSATAGYIQARPQRNVRLTRICWSARIGRHVRISACLHSEPTRSYLSLPAGVSRFDVI